MNPTRQALLELSKTEDISQLGLRELGRRLNAHPQTVKHHYERLLSEGLLPKPINMANSLKVTEDVLGHADLVTIPFLGAANCGPARHIAGSEPEGTLTISSRLLKPSRYDSLFAVKADGSSMNQANLSGQTIETGDYVIVDSAKQPTHGDLVLAVVNGLANIKKYQPESQNGELTRIALVSQSSDNFDPIFIHPEDQSEGLIAGVALQVIKRPQNG